MSLYGYARNTTPNLSKLAESATVYSHPVAAGNWTLPSHAAIFTGVFSWWSGIRSRDNRMQPISAQIPTLPELLWQKGYFTGAIAANSGVLIPQFGFDRGFEVFQSRNAMRVIPRSKRYSLRTGARYVLDFFSDTDDFDLLYARGDEITRGAFRFLDRAPSEKRPFFLFLNYMDAHGPYSPPAPFRSLFSQMIPGEHQAEINKRYAAVAEMEHPGAAELARLQQQVIAGYDGGIAYIDAQAGEVIRQLKERGLYDNTLIVITSDHGEAFGEHRYTGHGHSVYENETYVPLLIKYPHSQEKQLINKPVGHTDLFATMLGVVGAEPKNGQGVNLKTAENADREVFIEDLPDSPRRSARAVISGSMKYIELRNGSHVLYDLASDPAESRDLCEPQADRCSALKDRLERWTKTIPAVLPTRKLDSPALNNLRNLGYIAH
jgi:arylsulfatase A-like enzyme